MPICETLAYHTDLKVLNNHEDNKVTLYCSIDVGYFNQPEHGQENSRHIPNNLPLAEESTGPVYHDEHIQISLRTMDF